MPRRLLLRESGDRADCCRARGALCRRSARRALTNPAFDLKRQKRNDDSDSTNLIRAGDGRVGRRIAPVPRHELHPAGGVVHCAMKNRTSETALRNTSPVSFAILKYVASSPLQRRHENSLNVLSRKDERDGNNPTLSTHTAATESACRRISNLAAALVRSRRRVRGANIRGGGEFAKNAKAGNLTKKQNVFDDFAAAGEYLINENYTRPESAIQGGSNGGLLMGAMITQHPDLFRAVVSQ